MLWPSIRLGARRPLPETLKLDDQLFGESELLRSGTLIHIAYGLGGAFEISQRAKRNEFVQRVIQQQTLGELIAFIRNNLTRFGGHVPPPLTPRAFIWTIGELASKLERSDDESQEAAAADLRVLADWVSRLGRLPTPGELSSQLDRYGEARAALGHLDDPRILRRYGGVLQGGLPVFS